MPMTSTKSHPPLLQTYPAPSGPIASPLGLPPGVAIVSMRPSGCTRSTVRRLSSTHSTVPSGIHTGPSGNSSPVAISVISIGEEQRTEDSGGKNRA